MRTTVRMVANTICELDVAKDTAPGGIPSIVLFFVVYCPKYVFSIVFSLLLLSCTTNACLNHVFHLESNFPPLYLLKIMKKDLTLVTIVPSALSYVNDRIIKYLEGTRLFSHLQYGFRASRSTAYLLTVESKSIYNSLDVGGETMVFTLDISKFFDKVWHGGLLHKMKAYCVWGLYSFHH